jgi:hypothetical protein
MLFCLYYLVRLFGRRGGNFVSLEAPPIGGIMLWKASIGGLLQFESPTTRDFPYFLPVSIGFYID